MRDATRELRERRERAKRRGETLTWLCSLVFSVALVVSPWSVRAEPQTSAADALLQFNEPARQQRFKHLLEELRCLVCQNQTLADSDASLAHDLRKEVYALMQKGASDKEIIDFLVNRYGDFVLYRPPVKSTTYLLWYGPFLLLLAGVVVLFYFVRQRGREPRPALTAEERARLDQLLGRASGKTAGEDSA